MVHKAVGTRRGIARENELSFVFGLVATVSAGRLNKVRGRSCVGEIPAFSAFLLERWIRWYLLTSRRLRPGLVHPLGFLKADFYCSTGYYVTRIEPSKEVLQLLRRCNLLFRSCCVANVLSKLMVGLALELTHVALPVTTFHHHRPGVG